MTLRYAEQRIIGAYSRSIEDPRRMAQYKVWEAERRRIMTGRMPWTTRIRRLEELQARVGEPVILWQPRRGTRGAK